MIINVGSQYNFKVFLTQQSSAFPSSLNLPALLMSTNYPDTVICSQIILLSRVENNYAHCNSLITFYNTTTYVKSTNSPSGVYVIDHTHYHTDLIRTIFFFVGFTDNLIKQGIWVRTSDNVARHHVSQSVGRRDSS